ncbi:MAG TPA: type 4a pilus biogenesis protein PilO [Blastocatellia bacterium]|nr:type 4a pilus biogenesis protein PilO [Blastocatellia bacterium]
MKSTIRSRMRGVVRVAVAAGPSKTLLLTLIVCAVVGYLLHDQVFHPQHLDNESKAEQLAQVRAQNHADEELAASMPAFRQDLDRAEKDYTVVRAFLPDAPEVSVVLDAVQKLAAARKVRLTVFRDSGSQAKSALADKLNERVVPIQLFGGHVEITRFLADIASYPRVLHIRDIAITSERRGELVDATLVCYFAPSPSDLPPLPSDIQLSTFEGGKTQQ